MATDPLTEKDMDIVGNLFGVKLVGRSSEKDKFKLAEFYIEDDGYYFATGMKFDPFWIDDLIKVSKKVKATAAYKRSKKDVMAALLK